MLKLRGREGTPKLVAAPPAAGSVWWREAARAGGSVGSARRPLCAPAPPQVNLVSEHIWCEDFLVRSLYLKNLQTGETRTLTQFHFLSWYDQGVPSSTRSLLDFRRYGEGPAAGRRLRACSRGPCSRHAQEGAGREATLTAC